MLVWRRKMKLKIASYNISGGFYEDDQSVDFFDKSTSNDIDLRLLNDIIKNINNEEIDIICFQEIITTKRIHYIDRIMENTNLKYEENFETSPNNTIENTNVGIAILSKYPISKSIKKLFTNPMLSKTTSSGKTYYTFDKGLIVSTIIINGTSLNIMTHHGFPYRRFNSTPEENKDYFIEFDNFVKEYNLDIVTGDFNSENFMDLMSYTSENYIRSVNAPTTNDGKKFDDILLRKNTNYSSKVIKSLSDHFMIISEIELEKV